MHPKPNDRSILHVLLHSLRLSALSGNTWYGMPTRTEICRFLPSRTGFSPYQFLAVGDAPPSTRDGTLDSEVHQAPTGCGGSSALLERRPLWLIAQLLMFTLLPRAGEVHPAHREYLGSQIGAGNLIVSGPLLDGETPSGALLIAKVDSVEGS